MIVFVQHIEIEGPGHFCAFFLNYKQDVKIIRLYKGERLPENLRTIDAVIVLGGPMNVYEEDKYPFLKDENDFIKRVMAEGIPLLGICLGSQLIAKACGISVSRSRHPEIGWYQVDLTEVGQIDELFYGMNSSFEVFQWHEDTFEIPESGIHLAKSSLCENQAFQVNNNTYGLQFHVEISDREIKEWTLAYWPQTQELSKKSEQLINYYQENKKKFDSKMAIIGYNFLKIIHKFRAGKSM